MFRTKQGVKNEGDMVIYVAVAPELHEQVRAKAKSTNRSMSGHVRHVLIRDLESEGQNDE